MKKIDFLKMNIDLITQAHYQTNEFDIYSMEVAYIQWSNQTWNVYYCKRTSISNINHRGWDSENPAHIINQKYYRRKS